jgi:hypothetical protein
MTVLRHLVATLAYRAAKVVRDAPPAFASASFGVATRQPVRILAHMGDLLDWSLTLARGQASWSANGTEDWDAEVARVFARLAELDVLLQQEIPADAAEKLIQGPLADALTHVGQLALLRGLFGAPIRPESYARATIVAGRVGLDQPPAGREFDGDASRT